MTPREEEDVTFVMKLFIGKKFFPFRDSLKKPVMFSASHPAAQLFKVIFNQLSDIKIDHVQCDKSAHGSCVVR